jgi:iron complex transport system substrate-binding protein
MASAILTVVTSTSSGAASPYPVTIDSCGVKTTYTSAPTRAAVNDANQIEDMLALGLQSHIVGTWAVAADGPVDPKYRAANAKIHVVSPDHYFTLEQLVGLHPDFVYAGYNYGFEVGSPTLQPQYLTKFGIKSYVLAESCAHVQSSIQAASFSDIYTDLTNLGKIFNVRAKAAQVIAHMKSQVASTAAKTAHLKPISVFVCTGCTGTAPYTAAGLSMSTPMLAAAGGRDIFADLKVTYGAVSWEQVEARAPQCIVYNVEVGSAYVSDSQAAVLKFFRTSPQTKNLPAVKNGCLYPSYNDQITPDADSGDQVVAYAKWLHPKQFHLTPDGSPARET